MQRNSNDLLIQKKVIDLIMEKKLSEFKEAIKQKSKNVQFLWDNDLQAYVCNLHDKTVIEIFNIVLTYMDSLEGDIGTYIINQIWDKNTLLRDHVTKLKNSDVLHFFEKILISRRKATLSLLWHHIYKNLTTHTTSLSKIIQTNYINKVLSQKKLSDQLRNQIIIQTITDDSVLSDIKKEIENEINSGIEKETKLEDSYAKIVILTAAIEEIKEKNREQNFDQINTEVFRELNAFKEILMTWNSTIVQNYWENNSKLKEYIPILSSKNALEIIKVILGCYDLIGEIGYTIFQSLWQTNTELKKLKNKEGLDFFQKVLTYRRIKIITFLWNDLHKKLLSYILSLSREQQGQYVKNVLAQIKLPALLLKKILTGISAEVLTDIKTEISNSSKLKSNQKKIKTLNDLIKNAKPYDQSKTLATKQINNSKPIHVEDVPDNPPSNKNDYLNTNKFVTDPGLGNSPGRNENGKRPLKEISTTGKLLRTFNVSHASTQQFITQQTTIANTTNVNFSTLDKNEVNASKVNEFKAALTTNNVERINALWEGDLSFQTYICNLPIDQLNNIFELAFNNNHVNIYVYLWMNNSNLNQMSFEDSQELKAATIPRLGF